MVPTKQSIPLSPQTSGGAPALKGSLSRACRTREAVLKQIPSVINGEWMGRGSKRLGWLQTLRSCIRMLMTLMKCPVAKVSLVLKKEPVTENQSFSEILQ